MGILGAVLAAVTLATGDMPKGSKLLRGSCTTPDEETTKEIGEYVRSVMK